MNEPLMQALGDVFGHPDVWLIIIASACYGIFVGAIPGLTATMAVALFVPMAYWLDPVAAIAAIVTMVACAIFAGDLPTVYLRIPGTPASAAYADEAYELAQQGQAQRLLGVALTCSVIGGIVGAIVLMLLGSQLAKIARWFSVTEYFWLYLVGLGCAVLVALGGARWKALFALLLGLVLGGPLEERLIQSLTAAGGSPLGLVNRPIAIVLACIAVMMALVIVRTAIGERRAA